MSSVRKFALLLFSGNLAFSLTLKEAIKLAEQNDYRIKAQAAQYRADKNAYYSQIARRFGQITLFWNYNQYKTPRIVAPISPSQLLLHRLPQDDQVRVYGFRYAVRLFDGCQQYFLIRAKGKQAQLSLVNYEDRVAQTRAAVKELYFQILALKAQREALKERKKAVEELYRVVDTAYRVGKKSILDLLNIKAELKSVDAEISKVDTQIEALKRKLAILIGAKDTNFTVEPIAVKPVRLNADNLLNRLLAKNYKLREIGVQKRIVDYYKKAALSEFSPKVDFVYTKQRYVYAGTDSSDWQYSIQVSLPIFDFGLRFFNYKRAAEEELKVKELQRYAEEGTVQEFYALVNDLNSWIDVINADRDRLQFAKKAYKIEKQKYLLGKSDVYNLLKAEALYFGALGEYKASLYQWAAKKAKLDYMLGY